MKWTKKVLALLIALFVLAGSTSWAYTPSWMGYSATYTLDQTAVYSGDCWFYGIVAATDGTNTVTFVVYDSLTNAGTQIFPDWIATTSVSNRTSAISFSPPIRMTTGISVDITTAGTVSYVVYYREQ